MKRIITLCLILIFSVTFFGQNKSMKFNPSNETSVVKTSKGTNGVIKNLTDQNSAKQLISEIKSKAHKKKSTEATSRYVSLSGNDSWPGTLAQPWRTIKYAVANSVSGDDINISGGTFNETGQIVIDKEELYIYGQGAGITIITKAEDSGNPGSGNNRAWFLVTSDVGYLEMTGLTVDGTGKNISIGILSNAEYIYFYDCEVKNVGWQGGGAPNYYGRGICNYGGTVDIWSCSFENTGRIGVFTFGVGVLTNIVESYFTGKGAGDWLDYAFEAGGGAELDVYASKISDCIGVASSDGSTSAGILATTYFATGTSVGAAWCTITNCETGVAIGYDASDATYAAVYNNNLEGNDYAIYNSNTSNVAYGSLNWYGSNSPTFVAAQAGTGVHYSPWLDSNNDVDLDYPFFDPDYSALWVDDDSPGSGLIQEGIDLVSGSTVNVAPGTYNEAVNVNKVLTLIGAGSDVSGTIITNPGGTALTLGPGTNSSNRVIAKDLRLTNSATGVVVSSYNTLDNITAISNTVYGINLSSPNDLIVLNSKFNSSGSAGLKLSSGASATNISFTNCEFNDNSQHGWYADASSSVEPIFDNVNVTNTTFNNNVNKGIYTERLSNAVFDNITVNNSGTGGALNHRAGIDLNLKWRTDYTNIQILNSTITNCGAGDPNGGGILIKARSDGGTYGANPAALDNVLLMNVIVSNNGGTGLYSSGIRVGEANNSLTGTNPSPTNVIITRSNISGNSPYNLINATLATTVNASGNWFGSNVSANIVATLSGTIDYTPWLDVGTDVSGDPGFQPNLSTLWVSAVSPQTGSVGRIQEAVDMVSGSTVNVLAGTYNENVVVNKKIILQGAGSDISGSIISPSSGNGILLIASGASVSDRVTIKGFRIVSTAGNGIYLLDTPVSYATIENIVATGCYNGIDMEATGSNVLNVNDLLINNCSFIYNTGGGSGMGIRISKRANVDGLTIIGSYLDYNNRGIYAQRDAAWAAFLNNVNISSTSISENSYKATHIEKLSNAVFDGVTVNHNGYTGDQFATGLEINLKYGTYSNITIKNSTFINNGTAGNSPYSSGIALKARDDGSYAGNPASLSNVSMENNVIQNNKTGVLIGEPTKSNASPSNVTIISSKISGNTFLGISNETLASMVDAKYNWWGDVTGPYDNKTLPGNPDYNNPGGLGNAVTSYVDYQPWNLAPTYYNTPETAYKIYISSSTATTDTIIYPNTAWGVTSYETPPPAAGDDWDFTAPIEFYIVPEAGSKFGACDITLEWDNNLYSFGGVTNDGLFGSHFFNYNTLSGPNRVTINASTSDYSNFTTSPGQYIAKVSLNLLKPGYGPIKFKTMDFRYFDGLNPPLGVYVTGKMATVKSYLGDIASSSSQATGDGLVELADLTIWSATYWSGVPGYSGGMTNYKVKCDIGPTNTNTIYGLPTTDGKIQFEDLLIFAMSYGASGNGLYPKVAPVPTEPVEISVGKPIAAGSQTLVPIFISGAVQDLRAASLILSGSFGKFIGAENGDLLNSYTTPVMLLSRSGEGNVYVDLSLAGFDVKGISQAGQLVVLRFEGKANVNITSAELRNLANASMLAKLINNMKGIPTEFGISQNYPNPFNPSTMISYQVPVASMVEISVFNTIGEMVGKLVNEVKEPGYYEVSWNASAMPSGVYFFRINAGEFTAVKKMMLTK